MKITISCRNDQYFESNFFECNFDTILQVRFSTQLSTASNQCFVVISMSQCVRIVQFKKKKKTT